MKDILNDENVNKVRNIFKKYVPYNLIQFTNAIKINVRYSYLERIYIRFYLFHNNSIF